MFQYQDKDIFKACPLCGIISTSYTTYRDKGRKNGLASYCKKCSKYLKNTKYAHYYKKSHAIEKRPCLICGITIYYPRKTIYCSECKKKVLISHSNKATARYRKTIIGRLNYNISMRIRRSLNKGGDSLSSVLGYSLKKLKKHLESQFTEGMNWRNYGEWHIDHIIPISSFNFKSVKDKKFKECWGLSNLQPLWAKDNIAKGNKIL